MVISGAVARGVGRLLPRGYVFSVVGIAVGMAGLVALGALADRIARFLDGGHRFVVGQISVAGAGIGSGAGFTAGGLLPQRSLQAIRDVPGVAAVQAQVTLPFDPARSQFFSVNQEVVLGIDPAVPSPNRSYPVLPVSRGRRLAPGDRGRAVVGADFAGAHRLAVGSTLRIGDRAFEVVGVLERLLTAPDRFVVVPLEDARDLWLAVDPAVRALVRPGGPVARDDLNTGAAVGWQAGVEADGLAARLQREVPDVHVVAPGEVARQLEASTAFFSWLLAGVAGIGLLVGGLSLSNTVAAATFERIREFGIRRALGARGSQLLREVLQESLAVSLWGGALGVGLAVGGGRLVDLRAAHAGQQLFLFTPRLVAFALAFAALLGTVAGAYATGRILRLSPAEAIRRGA